MLLSNSWLTHFPQIERNMKGVKKFTTFEELKSCESNPVNYALRAKKHKEFQKVIMDIRSVKTHQSSHTKTTR